MLDGRRLHELPVVRTGGAGGLFGLAEREILAERIYAALETGRMPVLRFGFST